MTALAWLRSRHSAAPVDTAPAPTRLAPLAPASAEPLTVELTPVWDNSPLPAARNARFEALKRAVMWRQTAEDTGNQTDVQRACADVDTAAHELIDPSSLDSLPRVAEASTGGHV